MRRFGSPILLGLAALAGMASPAQAIVVTSTIPSDFVDPWTGTDWSFPTVPVYSWSGNSAVAVGDYFLLTNRHFGGGIGATLTIDGTTYTVINVYAPPNDPGQGVPPDIRLLKVDQRLPNRASLYNGYYADRPATILIGWGYNGRVYDTVYMIDYSTPMIKRWGTNQVDSVMRIYARNDPLPDPVWSSQCLVMYFDSTDTTYEAGFAFGDSGGGTFIKVGDQWRLAGINAYIGGTSKDHYNRLNSIDVSYYYHWITSTMTVPGDTDFDMDVDFRDYQVLESNFGVTTGATWEMGDFDNNGTVDFADYQLLEANFTHHAPEPATACLLLLTVPLLTRRR